MRSCGKRANEEQSANVDDRSEQKCIGAAGGVSAEKITGTPGDYRSQSVSCTPEFSEVRHLRRTRVTRPFGRLGSLRAGSEMTVRLKKRLPTVNCLNGGDRVA